MALLGFIFITTIIVTMMIVLFNNGTCKQYERLGRCPWIETSIVAVLLRNIRENTILANFRCKPFLRSKNHELCESNAKQSKTDHEGNQG